MNSTRSRNKAPDGFVPVPDPRVTFGGLSSRALTPSAKDRPPPISKNDRWRPEYATQAKHLALLGATSAEMALALGVSLDTFTKWLDTKYSLQLAMREARLASANVAASLYMRAVGYSQPQVKLFVVEDVTYEPNRDGSGVTKHVEKRVVEYEYTEIVAPDVRAAEIWLRNKERDRWGAKDGGEAPAGDTTHIQNNIFAPVVLTGLSADELAKQYREKIRASHTMLKGPGPTKP